MYLYLFILGLTITNTTSIHRIENRNYNLPTNILENNLKIETNFQIKNKFFTKNN